MHFLGHEIKLAILDLDGTLLASTSLWQGIDKEFFARRGMEVPPKYGELIIPLGLAKGAIFTKEEYGLEDSVESILNEWHQMAVEAYRNDIQLKPYARELLELLKANGLKLALATANSQELYEPCMKRLGILDFFDYITDVHIVNEGKNSSRIYDIITEHFGLQKENVVVIEDALGAMTTAHDAGYLTIGVFDPNTTKNRAGCEQNCDLFLENFAPFVERIQNENK